jgi:hypothetical protein
MLKYLGGQLMLLVNVFLFKQVYVTPRWGSKSFVAIN